MHNKLQAIFKFDAFWWINSNIVVLLRLPLILVICLWGKMKWGLLPTWGWLKGFSFQNVFYLKYVSLCLFFSCPGCWHATLLVLLVQKKQVVMWLANTNGILSIIRTDIEKWDEDKSSSKYRGRKGLYLSCT